MKTGDYCWHPDQIARLTDRQIKGYLDAAVRHNEAQKGEGAPSGLEAALATVPPLDDFCRMMTAEFPGEDPARWPVEWQKAKDIEAARGKPDRQRDQRPPA